MFDPSLPAADCLSRLPPPCKEDGSPDMEPETVAPIFTLLTAIPMSDFTHVCSFCPELSKLRTYMTKGWPASSKTLPADMIPYYQVRNELSVYNSLILRGTHRIVVPVKLRSHMIHLAHESHQGIIRTKQRLRDLYWWPKMDVLVESVIATCVSCQLNDKTTRTAPAPMTPVPLPDGPWQKLAVDIAGPFETGPADCNFAITMVDYYSKWPELCFAPQCTTATVISFMRSKKRKPHGCGDRQWSKANILRTILFPGETRYPTHRDYNLPSRGKWGVKRMHPYCTKRESSVENACH